MKKYTWILLILAIASKQAIGQAVKFEENLTWPEVIKKAKEENKFIFVDCYATWCVPCKTMDQQIYPNDSVGSYMNGHFISIKLQIDKTESDGQNIKNWYGYAKAWSSRYAITALPTFLFFSPDGRAVHKAIGAKSNAAGFLQVARDAQDPNKEYYNVKETFAPGKLDTAQERDLLNSFSADAQLTGRITADYLSRIPKAALDNLENTRRMILAGDNPEAMAFIIRFLNDKIRSNSLTYLNTQVLSNLNKNPQIRQIAEDYITRLNSQQLGESINIRLLIALKKDSVIGAIARHYIAALPDDSLYRTVPKINLVSAYIDVPTDRGFNEFYGHPSIVNAAAGKGSAERMVQAAITHTELDPLLNAAKQTNQVPDFEAIKSSITQKYNSSYADQIVAIGKVAWYLFVVHTKKQDQFWPQLNSARVAQFAISRPDTAKGSTNFVNDICFSELFPHCTNTQELKQAVGFMKNVVALNPDEPGIIDTYASLLYKLGDKRKAIKEETRAMAIIKRTNNLRDVASISYNFQQMKKGAKTWEDKKITGN